MFDHWLLFSIWNDTNTEVICSFIGKNSILKCVFVSFEPVFLDWTKIEIKLHFSDELATQAQHVNFKGQFSQPEGYYPISEKMPKNHTIHLSLNEELLAKILQ